MEIQNRKSTSGKMKEVQNIVAKNVEFKRKHKTFPFY